MNLYQLVNNKDPRFNKFGTAQEIWQHVQETGYEGKTRIVDGYPLPDQPDFLIEESYIKRASSFRLSHQLWNDMDRLIVDPSLPEVTNRVEAIEYALKVLLAVKDFGKVYAITPQGIQEYSNISECISLSPFFGFHNHEPVISRDKSLLENIL
ncbi:MAG: hypothetical protein SF052_13580 [Bacteroidia bacterium]|nr:hypothetical protein [Bacteroidia bacterium]